MWITLLTYMLTTMFDYRHGTAIAAIVNHAELVIAADSRVVNSADQPLEDTCKIHLVHGTVIAGHGLATDKATGYDLFALAANAARHAVSLQEAATEIARAGTKPVEAVLTSLRAGQPDVFARKAADISPGVILARWEGDRPALGYIQFVPTIESQRISVHPEVHLCPGPDCLAGQAGVFVAPVFVETEAFKSRHPHYAMGNIVDTARQFVQQQIDRRRPSVGPPIDIIRLKRGHAEWIQQKVSCSLE